MNFSLPDGWAVEYIDFVDREGYRLHNPEGHIFGEYLISKTESPGKDALLQAGAQKIGDGIRRREILEREERVFRSKRV